MEITYHTSQMKYWSEQQVPESKTFNHCVPCCSSVWHFIKKCDFFAKCDLLWPTREQVEATNGPLVGTTSAGLFSTQYYKSSPI